MPRPTIPTPEPASEMLGVAIARVRRVRRPPRRATRITACVAVLPGPTIATAEPASERRGVAIARPGRARPAPRRTTRIATCVATLPGPTIATAESCERDARRSNRDDKRVQTASWANHLDCQARNRGCRAYHCRGTGLEVRLQRVQLSSHAPRASLAATAITFAGAADTVVRAAVAPKGPPVGARCRRSRCCSRWRCTG